MGDKVGNERNIKTKKRKATPKESNFKKFTYVHELDQELTLTTNRNIEISNNNIASTSRNIFKQVHELQQEMTVNTNNCPQIHEISNEYNLINTDNLHNNEDHLNKIP